MELLVEAQLILESPLTPGLAPAAPKASQGPSCDELARKLDGYLAAAGAADELLRRRMVLRTVEKLEAEGDPAKLPWVKAVAALDEVLSSELLPQPGPHGKQQGRIALYLGGARQAGWTARDWATPPRRYLAMPASSLAPWRPSWRQLGQIRVPRFAQGIAACLCWLAVLVLP